MSIPPNFPSIRFDAPDKICSRCGRVIPTNGWATNEKGEVLTNEKGRAIEVPNARLICECWREVKVPQPPPRPRRKKGEPKYTDQQDLGLQPGEKIR